MAQCIIRVSLLARSTCAIKRESCLVFDARQRVLPLSSSAVHRSSATLRCCLEVQPGCFVLAYILISDLHTRCYCSLLVVARCDNPHPHAHVRAHCYRTSPDGTNIGTVELIGGRDTAVSLVGPHASYCQRLFEHVWAEISTHRRQCPARAVLGLSCCMYHALMFCTHVTS